MLSLIILILFAVMALFIFLAIGACDEGIQFGHICGAFVSGILAISCSAVLIFSTIPNAIIIPKDIESKIEIYQEENSQIEEDIKNIVQTYDDYDENTCTVSPSCLMELYPKLKTNELVIRQIDVYTANQTEIKVLKRLLVDTSTAKFMLYFKT